jgi:hypothetical protein
MLLPIVKDPLLVNVCTVLLPLVVLVPPEDEPATVAVYVETVNAEVR